MSSKRLRTLGRFQICFSYSHYYAYMGISEVMHFERSLFQKMKGYSQEKVGTTFVCMHHVDVTFRFWGDSLRTLLLDCHAIEASREV